MEFTDRELQMLQYALKALILDIKSEQEWTILTQTERKMLKNNQRTCKNLLDKIEKEMSIKHIKEGSDILTNIMEIDGEFFRGYK